MNDYSFMWLFIGIPAIAGLCLGYLICHSNNKKQDATLINIQARLRELSTAHEESARNFDDRLEKASTKFKLEIHDYQDKSLELIEEITNNNFYEIKSKLNEIDVETSNINYKLNELQNTLEQLGEIDTINSYRRLQYRINKMSLIK